MSIRGFNSDNSQTRPYYKNKKIKKIKAHTATFPSLELNTNQFIPQSLIHPPSITKTPFMPNYINTGASKKRIHIASMQKTNYNRIYT